jgi:hypothetical protein
MEGDGGDPRIPTVGKYKADYSPLSAEDLAKPDPELEELFANSTPALAQEKK